MWRASGRGFDSRRLHQMFNINNKLYRSYHNSYHKSEWLGDTGLRGATCTFQALSIAAPVRAGFPKSSLPRSNAGAPVTPTIVFNIGWMRRYRGQTASDRIFNGGQYVDENDTGGEIKNFLPRNGRCRGFVQLPGRSMNMQRLGTSAQAKWLDGVTVVFSATRPEGGGVVIGWYRNARVWREYQAHKPFGFIAEAPAKQCILLDEDERVFAVPRARNGKFGLGKRNVRYLDQPVARSFVRRIHQYIQQTEHPPPSAKGRPRNGDSKLRKKVETAAVRCVFDYYEARGFDCVSVEHENLGWDLECSLRGRKLLVEVKGCSGAVADVELTPNEYASSLQHPHRYRIAIVTTALSRPELAIVRRNGSDGKLRDQHDNLASLDERTAARIRLANGT